MRDATLAAGWPNASAQIGFFGKIPSRGDFVRAGLPRSFISPWDEWLQAMLPASREALGETWQDAWMVAPIWRFLIQPGICGPDAVLGVFMPSVDRAGRYFPLTLACVANRLDAAEDAQSWLDGAEAAGIAALEHDIEPDGLAEMLQPGAQPANDTQMEHAPVPVGDCAWWTEGAPRVPATAFVTRGLPGAAVFAHMLDAQGTGAPVNSAAAVPRS